MMSSDPDQDKTENQDTSVHVNALTEVMFPVLLKLHLYTTNLQQQISFERDVMPSGSQFFLQHNEGTLIKEPAK